MVLQWVEQKGKKRGMLGHNGMGYCPFSVLGLDLEMVLRQEGSGAHDRWDQAGLWLGHDFHVVARAAVGVSRHGPWCRDMEDAREMMLGCDTLFGVSTWVGLLGLRPEIGVATG